jgi:hypothetical protein
MRIARLVLLPSEVDKNSGAARREPSLSQREHHRAAKSPEALLRGNIDAGKLRRG